VSEKSATAQLASFIAKFTPEVAASAKEALARIRKRWPGAIELVYDNYNALAIGFAPTERVRRGVLDRGLPAMSHPVLPAEWSAVAGSERAVKRLGAPGSAHPVAAKQRPRRPRGA
jgi:hypothetical protein